MPEALSGPQVYNGDMGNAWVWIALAGILAGSLKQWLQFRSTQRDLGASARELTQEVAELKRMNEALVERVENLEAIVVSQTWDALHDKGLAPADRERRVASAAHREMSSPEPGAVNRQRAEDLARRLRG
jgi:hypothetical protein